MEKEKPSQESNVALTDFPRGSSRFDITDLFWGACGLSGLMVVGSDVLIKNNIDLLGLVVAGIMFGAGASGVVGKIHSKLNR